MSERRTSPGLWERVDRWSPPAEAARFLGLSLPVWGMAGFIACTSLRRFGLPDYDSAWAGDLLLKLILVPLAILLTLPAFDSLYRVIESPTSPLPRRSLARVTAALLFTPLTLVVLAHAWKLLTFPGSAALLRDRDFLWQAFGWLLATGTPALVAVDALRTGAWDPRRGLRIVGRGILVWVWVTPLTVLVVTRSLLGWDQMIGLYAPLTLIALGCLVAGRRSRLSPPASS